MINCSECGHDKREHPKIKHSTGRWKGKIRSEDCLNVTDYKKCPCQKFEEKDGWIGCTKCYKRKKDCECVLPSFHRIFKRAWYYDKFEVGR